MKISKSFEEIKLIPTGAIKANYIVVNEERYGLIGLKKCYSVTSDKNEIQ